MSEQKAGAGADEEEDVDVLVQRLSWRSSPAAWTSQSDVLTSQRITSSLMNQPIEVIKVKLTVIASCQLQTTV